MRYLLEIPSVCRSSGFCAAAASYQPKGILQLPLSLFILSTLPVLFLLFFLFKANSTYTKAWKRNKRQTAISLISEDGDAGFQRYKRDPETSTSNRVSAINMDRSPEQEDSQRLSLIPFYYSFIQFVSLCYAVNFILRGFFSNVGFVDKILVPVVFCVLEFAQVVVICFMFIQEMNSKSKWVACGIAALISIGDMAIRFVFETEGLELLNVRCSESFVIYWICWNGIYLIASISILCLRFTSYRTLVRETYTTYLLFYFIVSLINCISVTIMYFGVTIGICTWIIGYAIYYGLYAPVLYHTLVKDSNYWYWKLDREEHESQPLLFGKKKTRTLKVDLDDDKIISWMELDFGKSIGRGGHGEVFLAKWKGRQVAVKRLFFRDPTDKDIQEFKREIQILSKLNHPNILNMLGACVEVTRLAIITEYMPRGNLQDFLYDETQHLDWKLRIQIAKDIANGVAYLHSIAVIHRDLKSSNLLLGENLKAKLCDFGIARFKDERTMTMVGTVHWTAPEVLKGKKYSSSIDAYSFGIILWELVARKLPYEGLLSYEVITQVAQNGLRPDIPFDCITSYKELMESCWEEEPSLRPTFPEILLSLL